MKAQGDRDARHGSGDTTVMLSLSKHDREALNVSYCVTLRQAQGDKMKAQG